MKGGFDPPASPGFWGTIWILLRAARKRAVGRQRRQQELLRQRSRKRSFNISWLGLVATILLTALLHGIAAFVVYRVVETGERVEVEAHGKIVVRESFLRAAEQTVSAGRYASADPEDSYAFRQSLYTEAHHIAHIYGDSPDAIENRLSASVRAHGTDDLIAEQVVAPGLEGLPQGGRFPAMLGSIVLLIWSVSLICQGEGLELDLQRRRHPMWEWLFSHPVPPGAVFMAEMLSPIAANPIYCTAPLFTGILYGLVYGLGEGILAAFIIGIPVAVAAAFLGKALEIAIILRFAPRSRGAIVGLMSWWAYASTMLFFIGAAAIDKVASVAGGLLSPLTAIAWPWLGLFLGQSDDSFSFIHGMLACWLFSGVTMAGAVGFSTWAARQGLGGNFGKADAAPSRARGGAAQFGKKPLYRKEFLWFIRDRSAIVQAILVPLTIAGFQLFNLRGLLVHAQNEWNYLCGAGILFGTYFLWVLGPKSLASEGTALWITLTWPQGLEKLLRAKAWLWSMISSGIVALVFLYAAFLFPLQAWKIALVGAGWYVFGRSMAEKAVTLVRAPSSSEDPEKISRNRQWAASLGMLTFGIGILTQQWHIAVMGIVYSYVTAAAMWENFRARLPFLYDPWSEKLPSPPTLMHAMISISLLVEVGAIFTSIALAIYGRENLAMLQAVIYGICAVTVSLGLARFLSNRGVSAAQVWCWPQSASGTDQLKPWWCGDGTLNSRFLLALTLGIAGGLALGLLALGYIALLLYFPATAEIIQAARAQLASIPGLQLSNAIMAVGFAPFAEEYLFRGLLFRALDREWGGWRAILGSAAFFAVYHPLLSWIPVGALGVANALLFKKTGRLAPAVAMHMAYNAVVVFAQF